MELGPVVMTSKLAVLVWQDTNKLAGLVEGDGAGTRRFWACMHMFMKEGLMIGDVGTHPRNKSWDGMSEEMSRLQALGPHWRSGQGVEDRPYSPVDIQEAIAAAPGTGAGAEAGQLMMLEGLEEEVEGGDAAEQGGAEEVRGDSTEEEVLPSTDGTGEVTRELQVVVAGHGLQAEVESDSEGEEMAQACDPPVSLDWDFTAQYEAMLRRQWQAGGNAGRLERHYAQGRSRYWWEELKDQTAVQGQKESGRQGAEDEGERDCSGAVSEECHAWQEAGLVAEGKMEVPRLRTGCRATQVPTEDEVQVVATSVGAEGSRRTLGKRGQGGAKQQRRGRAAVPLALHPPPVLLRPCASRCPAEVPLQPPQTPRAVPPGR